MVRLVTVAAVVMGVLIVVGTATLLVMVLGRRPPMATAEGPTPAPANGPVVLDEPPGTRIVAASGPGEALVLLLQGGGPDRVVTIDSRSGRVASRIALARDPAAPRALDVGRARP